MSSRAVSATNRLECRGLPFTRPLVDGFAEACAGVSSVMAPDFGNAECRMDGKLAQ